MGTVFTSNAAVNGYLSRMPFTPCFSCTIFITYIVVMSIFRNSVELLLLLGRRAEMRGFEN